MTKKHKKQKADYYSVTETAGLLGLKPARVRAMCGQQQIAAIKVGSNWIVPAAEVDRAKLRKTTPGPEPRNEREL